MTGTRLRQVRDKMLLSRQQFAELLAVDARSIVRWEARCNDELADISAAARRILARLDDAKRRARSSVAMREYGWAAAWAILFSNGEAR